MENPLFMNVIQTIGNLFYPTAHFSYGSSIFGFPRNCIGVFKDVAFQVSFAHFHDQDHSYGVFFPQQCGAVKLCNVRMIYFSDEQVEFKGNEGSVIELGMDYHRSNG